MWFRPAFIKIRKNGYVVPSVCRTSPPVTREHLVSVEATRRRRRRPVLAKRFGVPSKTSITTTTRMSSKSAATHNGSRNKTVRFDGNDEVRYVDRNDETRCGRCWLQAVADRERFRRHVARIAIVLNPILTFEHRISMRLRNMSLSIA